ncbi:MAG TPA: hypothetical protein VNT79_10415 [Phycisphaerae bacterium]|nr:hypothetical protein [Phycisphaerae bacterium]
MNPSRDFDGCSGAFTSQIEAALRERPALGGRVGVSRAPGVVDVMGGIGEDAGSLVLTASTGMSHLAAAWPTGESKIQVRILSAIADEDRDFSAPVALIEGAEAGICRQCESDDAAWAAAPLLAIRRVIEDGVAPALQEGLSVLIEHDFPVGCDLGRLPSIAVAAADAYCRMHGIAPEALVLARSAAAVVTELTGLQQLRKTMTAIVAPANNTLLQLQFYPAFRCDPLELPAGVIVKAACTRLSRPTSVKRLIETRLCSEMGHRVIQELQRQDGQRVDVPAARLSSITPAEFVERFRDRMPSKMTQQQFATKFGALRGLPEKPENPKEPYKVRSRTEHHIYENRRVHDFATHVVRARRGGPGDALVDAGELMYASHWSHSQRCGIGGVETDRFVNFVRAAGPDQGLYGAKVTAGGEGGELIVLMRDDAQAHAAVANAAKRAKELSKEAVHLFEGALPGAQHFVPPEFGALRESAGVA